MNTLIAALLILASIGISLGGVIAIRRRVQLEELKSHHEVGGYVFNAIVLIYGVMLAFVVFVVWSNYEEARDNVAMEADAITDVLRLTEGFPAEDRAAIRNALAEYSRLAIADEWPAMRARHESARTEAALESLWRVIVRTSGRAESSTYDHTLDRLTALGDARRGRIRDSTGGMPAIIWALVIVGAIIVIAFTYFFGTQSLRVQVVMTVALAAEIALVLFVILAIDQPFRGTACIDAAPLQKALEAIEAPAR